VTDRRFVGQMRHEEYNGRTGDMVCATFFVMRGQVYELTYSAAPHWIAENVEFELKGVTHEQQGVE